MEDEDEGEHQDIMNDGEGEGEGGGEGDFPEGSPSKKKAVQKKLGGRSKARVGGNGERKKRTPLKKKKKKNFAVSAAPASSSSFDVGSSAVSMETDEAEGSSAPLKAFYSSDHDTGSGAEWNPVTLVVSDSSEEASGALVSFLRTKNVFQRSKFTVSEIDLSVPAVHFLGTEVSSRFRGGMSSPRLFTCTDHATFPAVSATTAVVAESEENARGLLQEALESVMKIKDKKPFTLNEVPMVAPTIRVLSFGEKA